MTVNYIREFNTSPNTQLALRGWSINLGKNIFTVHEFNISSSKAYQKLIP